MLEYIVAILIVAAFMVLAVKKEAVAIAAILISFFVMVFLFLQNQMVIVRFGEWVPPFGIVWVMDKLNVMMGVLITGISSLVAIYSLKYVKERKHKFYGLLCLMTVGLLGVSMTGDIFNMYVFFEILSIASYGLVAFNLDDDAIEGALKYLVLGPLASSFILLGIAMLYGLAGTLNMADLALKIQPLPIFHIALGFLIGGFALKSAIVPFHFWLPDVHPVAPTPISAMLSSVVVGTGIYSVLRIMFTIFGLSGVFWVFVALGLITMVTGGIIAISQTDIKRMIAFSTISQSGYIFLAVGLGTNLGIAAGLFHLLNNMLIKAMLFLAAGIIIWHTGLKDMNELGGLGRQLPVTMLCFGIGSLSIIGIPPFNGFASKWMIYMATWEISPLLTAVAIIVSAITMIYYLKAFSCMFFGPSRINIEKQTPKVMLIPVVILTIICVVLGLFPQIGLNIIEPAANALLNQNQYITAVLGGR